MRYANLKLTWFVFMAAVLASSSASAELDPIAAQIDITTRIGVVVTIDGSSVQCMLDTDTTHFVLQPQIGAYQQAARGAWCGGILFEMLQSLEVNSLFKGDSTVTPWSADNRSILRLYYPDGTLRIVLDKHYDFGIPTELKSWTAGAALEPQSSPGVEFQYVNDDIHGYF